MKSSVIAYCILLPLLGRHNIGLAQVLPVSLQAGRTITLPTKASPSAIAIADYNQDTHLDIAVCERGLGQVEVYLQNTNGSDFSSAGVYSIGQSPSGLVTVNGQSGIGRYSADLIAISGPSSKWTVLNNKNDNTGTFTIAPPSIYGFGTGQPAANPQLLTANLDNDLYPDLAYTYDGQNDNFVKWDTYTGGPYIQDRDSPFRTTSAMVLTSLAVDDFNRDGHMDVVVTEPATNQFIVAFAPGYGTGPPRWGAGTPLFVPSTGRQPRYVATADVTQDNLPDIAIAHAGSNEVTVFVNLAGTQFGSQYSYPLVASPTKVLLSDLNRDGNPEMLVTTADGKLLVYQHSGARSSLCYTTPPLTLATGVEPTTLQIADINTDGYPDVVVACAGNNTVYTFLNRTFNTVTATHQAQLIGVAVFPTLATNQLTIQYANITRGPLTATLIDQLGRSVQEQQIQQVSTNMDVANLPRGLYLLRLVGATASSTTRVILR
jgi:hypothetical protein